MSERPSLYPMVPQPQPGRIRAMLRWLLDEGHITPMGVRQLEELLKEATRPAIQDEVDTLIDQHVLAGGYPTNPRAGSSALPSPAPRPGPGGAA